MNTDDRNRATWKELQREQQVRKLRFGWKPDKPRDVKRKLEPFAAGSVSLTPPEELTEYLNTFLPVFGRRDTVMQARYYLLGLLSNLRRKNGETMEAAVPGATQQGVWDFLVRSPWPSEDLDRARVLDALQRSGCAGQPLAAVLDEVSWQKKGNLSVGVGRQYLGSIGKVDNGQVTVSLHGCHPQIDLPLLSELYLPEPWLTAERRAQAKIPLDRTFESKPQIGLRLLDRTMAWGLSYNRVFADPGYADLAFIAGLRQRALAFCLGLKSTAACWHANEAWTSAIPAPPYLGRGRHRVGVPAKPRIHTVAEIRQGIAADQWRQVAYRDGVDGKPLVREFVALRAHLTNGQQVKDGITPDASDELWLLLERPIGSTDKNGIKQYAISGPDAMSLDELAQISHVRPVIERNSYENAKQEIGLSQYQGRTWVGFHHHLSMAWLALTFLILHRRPLPPPPGPVSPPDSSPPAPHRPPDPVAPPTVSFGTTSATLTMAMPAREPLPRPRQLWESVQEVHRRLVEWFHAMRFRECLFARRLPALPAIGAVPASP